jgi:SWI/SNF-related matrix-associated actin-dependent regulator 1 of chromatin subfamily A
MPSATYTGAFWTISAKSSLNTYQKEWIHSVPSWSFEKATWCWLLPIDLVTADDLADQGFNVTGALPPVAPAPHITPDELFVPLPLEPYQLEGVEWLLRDDRRILADEPGLGKTRQMITVLFNIDAARALVVVPKAAITDPWINTLTEICNTISADRELSVTQTEGNLVTVLNSTHAKRLDGLKNGIVLTTDSALRSNEETVKKLIEWGPQVLFYDEAHNAKNFTSRVSKTMRAIAMQTPLVYVASGTPFLKDMVELLPLFVMTKTVELFGGVTTYLDKYTYTDKWGTLKGKRSKETIIRGLLDSDIWVRRTKREVLPDLPPKKRRFSVIDVPLDTVQDVHDAVNDRIDKWLVEFEQPPTSDEIREWTKENVACITEMRVAAGVSKIDEVNQRVKHWFEVHGSARPLVLWGCYQDVLGPIYAHAEAMGLRVGRLDGSKSKTQRNKTVVAFQEGQLDLVIASIYAAGTAITLTRSHDVVFAELDWTPDLMIQAEDRCHRFGQTKTVNVTSIIARGTLDEHIQKVLQRKINFLDRSSTGDHSVTDRQVVGVRISELLESLVTMRVAGLYGRDDMYSDWLNNEF